jgi:hypothetical protein
MSVQVNLRRAENPDLGVMIAIIKTDDDGNELGRTPFELKEGGEISVYVNSHQELRVYEVKR